MEIEKVGWMSHYLWHFSKTNTYGVSIGWDAKIKARYLGKSQLGGVIFGAKNTTFKECLLKKLFVNLETKMAHISDLPLEVLNMVITMLAMAPGGAGDLVRASSVCKLLMSLASHPDVLRVVSFENFQLIGGGGEHCHWNGLLCRCVLAGNLAAECQLGKAVLVGRAWSRLTLQERLSRLPSLANGITFPKVVRTFILHASFEDIAPMESHLFAFFRFFCGSEYCIPYNLYSCIHRLCLIGKTKLEIQRIKIRCENEPRDRGLLAELSRHIDNLEYLTPLEGSPVLRDWLITCFDQEFPSHLVPV